METLAESQCWVNRTGSGMGSVLAILDIPLQNLWSLTVCLVHKGVTEGGAAAPN